MSISNKIINFNIIHINDMTMRIWEENKRERTILKWTNEKFGNFSS